jgi:hypothetical protein
MPRLQWSSPKGTIDPRALMEFHISSFAGGTDPATKKVSLILIEANKMQEAAAV